MSCDQLERIFPALREAGYSRTSPKTNRYNCIAWAASYSSRWWWPDPSPLSYWPDHELEWSVDAFVKVFEAFGYAACESADVEFGFEKIAIYVKDGLPSHMARQLAGRQWTSKCGRLEDISHTLEGLEGEEYGTVSVVMRRPMPQATK